ncbi:hypothetical protein ACOJBM_29455 [Rhizobium beringeri]
MRGDKLWSEDEIAIVHRLAPDYDAICKLIPHRTRKAIRVQASVFGKANKRHCWTGAEVALYESSIPKPAVKSSVKVFRMSAGMASARLLDITAFIAIESLMW